jgi:phage baseplate assembly protein W
MKTLALVGGDLALGEGGYRLLTGAARIRQDLALALAVPYGHDPYHPTYGSVLESYVGEPLTPELELLVRSEVVRVVQEYVAAQQASIAADALSGSRARYSHQDVVKQVQSITTEIAYDVVRVRVALKTEAGETVRIARTVDL